MAKNKAKTSKDNDGVKSLRDAALAKSAGPVRRLDRNETVTVRFLYEMNDTEGWAYLQRVHNEAQSRTFYYRADAEVSNARQSFFAVALDVDSGSVEVWELRKTMVTGLIEYDDNYSTIIDRNYRLRRKGENLNTTHTATPMDTDGPGKKRLAKSLAKAEGKLAAALDELLSYVE